MAQKSKYLHLRWNHLDHTNKIKIIPSICFIVFPHLLFFLFFLYFPSFLSFSHDFLLSHFHSRSPSSQPILAAVGDILPSTTTTSHSSKPLLILSLRYWSNKLHSLYIFLLAEHWLYFFYPLLLLLLCTQKCHHTISLIIIPSLSYYSSFILKIPLIWLFCYIKIYCIHIFKIFYFYFVY